MICISWNCRELGNLRTVCALNDLVRDRKPDVLFIMKTISTTTKIEKLRVNLGFANCFQWTVLAEPEVWQFFGKILLSVSLLDTQNHIDLVSYEGNNAIWRMSCFYGYPERTRRNNS